MPGRTLSQAHNPSFIPHSHTRTLLIANDDDSFRLNFESILRWWPCLLQTGTVQFETETIHLDWNWDWELRDWIKSCPPLLSFTLPIAFNMSFVAGGCFTKRSAEWVRPQENRFASSRIFVTFCAQRSLNLLHSGLWCSRTEGGHFNGGWIILPAKTSCCSKVIALRSTLASVSGQCTPEVDILSDQFASSKQDRAIFQPRNRMFSQDPLSFFFQLDN